MWKRWIKMLVLGGMAAGLAIFSGDLTVNGKTVVNSEQKAKIGTSYQIKIKGTKYSVQDAEVAYVNQDGLVTAKNLGETVIKIRKDGEVYTQHLTVVANGKKKRGVKVCTGEIAVVENSVVSKDGAVKKKKMSSVIEVPPVPSDMLAHVSPEPEKTAVPEKTIAEKTETPEETMAAAETGTPAETAAPEKTAAPVETGKPAAGEKKNQKVVLTAGITLKNQGEYKAKKVILYAAYKGKTYKLNFGALDAGEEKTVQKKIKLNASDIGEGQMNLKKILVYSNKMITSYKYASQKTSLLYGTKDTKAPVISGFIGKNSYNQGMTYMVVYADDKDYDYFKYVKAEDDRDTEVDLKVNTDQVNFKKAGKYKITYIAKDSAGNTAKAKSQIEVRIKRDVDRYASEILSRITKPGWSVYQKATAIYNYTRHHISYVGYSKKGNWENGAITGIRYGRGDCFTYYAVARALLTRAGIPNILVKRYRGAGRHWWNMVYVNGGWYHYDCGPRPGGGRFCMLTDEQLTAYSKTHGNKYIWNYDAVPKSPKKKLTSVF